MTTISAPVAIQARKASNEIRWAAAALVVGCSLFIGGIVLGLRTFAGDWDRTVGLTLPTTAGIIRDNWPVFRQIWFGEMCAALLIAVAAFQVQSAGRPHGTRVPRGPVWIVVGVGSILVAVQYAFTLGSYPPALEVFEQNPSLFAALRGGVLFVSAAGSVLQLGGLLILILASFRWKVLAPSDRLNQTAAAISLSGIALAITGLIPGEYGAAAVFLGGAILGVAMWRTPGLVEHSIDELGSAA
jgi:hypothetical protein